MQLVSRNLVLYVLIYTIMHTVVLQSEVCGMNDSYTVHSQHSEVVL